MTGQEKRGQGRPPNELYDKAQNASAASQERIDALMVAILKTIKDDARFSAKFEHIETAKLEKLTFELAHEVAFLPAMQGLIDSTKRDTTGPKPKTAQTILVTQVHELLSRHKVELKQWRNARDRRTALADFCDVLVAMSGAKTGGVSTRTIGKAPSQGFR